MGSSVDYKRRSVKYTIAGPTLVTDGEIKNGIGSNALGSGSNITASSFERSALGYHQSYSHEGRSGHQNEHHDRRTSSTEVDGCLIVPRSTPSTTEAILAASFGVYEPSVDQPKS